MESSTPIASGIRDFFKLNTEKTQQEQSPLLEWPEPRPISAIKQGLSPVITMSPEIIPGPYRDWLTDISDRMQCPLDYVAVGAVIVTASLIGAGCSIRPKAKDSWTVIPNLWGGIIGSPGTLKSPALKEILKPIEALEAQAHESHDKEQHSFLVDMEVYKATKEALKKDMIKAAGDSNVLALGEIKEKLKSLREPQAPICKRYSTNDATIEKMHLLLSQNPRGLLLFRDELMGLLMNWDKDGQESDRSFYLEAWNGYGSKTTDRIGRGTIHTQNMCISLMGSTQPSKLLAYFGRTLDGTENDGLLQRFQLLVYPDEPCEWALIDRSANDEARDQAFKVITKLMDIDFCRYGGNLETSSRIPWFRFNPEAQEIFYVWLTKLEHRLRNSNEEPLMIEHLAKYRKLLPSLALIFHLIDIASGNASGSVTVECIERAIQWCSYLESHARRIYGMSFTPAYQGARSLAKKIQNGELQSFFDKRDLYRKGWSFLKNKEDVEWACRFLIESGWLKETDFVTGGRPKSTYVINPKVTQNSSGF